MSTLSKHFLLNWLLLLVTPLRLLKQHVNEKSEWLPFFFLLHLSSSRDAYSAHSYTSHHCLPHHYSYRWSFVFVVAYSILCQSHFSKDIERITSINLPSKIEELLAQYIACSRQLQTIVPHPTTMPTNQLINPLTSLRSLWHSVGSW